MSSPFAIPGVVPASHLQRPAPLTVSSGLDLVDALTGGGLPRGALTEICGLASSGRTSLLLSALAEAGRRQEICALVDAGDSFDPHGAAAAGVELERLLWVRCGSPRKRRANGEPGHGFTPIYTDRNKSQIKNQKSKIEGRAWLARVEQALKATDLLLQGGGFGVVAVDLADVPAEVARRVPLASWFRFRRAVEHTPTVLLVVEQQPYARTCASLVLRTTAAEESAIRATAATASSATPSHAQLFCGVSVQVEVLRGAEGMKKPAQRAGPAFATRAEWAG